MINRILYIAMIFLVFSCQTIDKASKPENIIEEDKMVEILIDIAFVKSAKSSFNKKMELNKLNPEGYILEKHGIDSLVFAQNNAWYMMDLENYQKIFTRVKDTLEKSKDMYEALKKKEDSIKKIEDSIKASKGIKIEKNLRIPDELMGAELEEEIEEEIKEAKKKRIKPLSKKQ
ncbi:DUF4296 domain-containing protein [Aquimarina sp. 2201CG5-10]|uniref:DUF4296 domain-containing protein n=1 Tax=Aquimarina callyspongiae TaxID=3098150 RepID=UPI002AB3E2C1|nr:DUF4296 domain-containing protein [Aquimarina sp. 2201CG5-10]MDY8134984.1 DUF4296 domain-containing protein [Aquimarina sp. 2201CG5-10]